MADQQGARAGPGLLQADDRRVLRLADRFKTTMARVCQPWFVGVWDTVSSVGWIENPLKLPFSANNPDIAGRASRDRDRREARVLPHQPAGSRQSRPTRRAASTVRAICCRCGSPACTAMSAADIPRPRAACRSWRSNGCSTKPNRMASRWMQRSGGKCSAASQPLRHARSQRVPARVADRLVEAGRVRPEAALTTSDRQGGAPRQPVPAPHDSSGSVIHWSVYERGGALLLETC